MGNSLLWVHQARTARPQAASSGLLRSTAPMSSADGVSLSQRFAIDIRSLLTGGVQEAIPLPCSWDELLDWCETANALSSLCSKGLPVSDNKASIDLRFTPRALIESVGKVNEIENMSWLQRASFYAESVVVVARLHSGEAQPLLISLGMFVRYLSLLSRLSDLWLLLKESRHSESKNNGPQECIICLSDMAEEVVLSCGHILCRDCEKRWVRRRLKCPFCRHVFRNELDVARSSWEVTGWSREDLLLDISRLERQVDEFWETSGANDMQHDALVLLLDLYVERPYRLGLSDGPDDFVLISASSKAPSTSKWKS